MLLTLLIVGAGVGIYFAVAYASWDEVTGEIQDVSSNERWYSDTDCWTRKVGDTWITTCDTDYYYSKTFTINLGSAGTYTWTWKKEITHSQYDSGYIPSDAPELHAGQCVMLSGPRWFGGDLDAWNCYVIGCSANIPAL